jgi:hypothetical protein
MLSHFYRIKPYIPRTVQIFIRRQIALRKRECCGDIWPISKESAKKPHGWGGWPDDKQFALVLTHDVESATGVDKCLQVMELEEKLGFRSSFNFVPADYAVDSNLRHSLTKRNFEVGVHGLSHDGSLYKSKEIFQSQALHINRYLKEWGAVGFRSPAMHHNLDWIRELDIEYDASTFDTDPFEPQPDGMHTIFPFWVNGDSHHKGYVELPYTLPQDFTLFVILKEKSINVWKRKLDWIAANGGMALLITHPDYMNFGASSLKVDEFPVKLYEDFLKYIRDNYEGRYWHVLSKDMATFVKSHNS